MNIKKIFWRFWTANKEWNDGKKFEIHYAEHTLDGILYCGLTVFGVTILYSTEW